MYECQYTSITWTSTVNTIQLLCMTCGLCSYGRSLLDEARKENEEL